MTRLSTDLPCVHLNSAEVCISRAPKIIETVLGSCVAVVLWSPRLRIGGMCHAALPRMQPSVTQEPGIAIGLRYVDYAIPFLLERMFGFGATARDLVVKLFGGADMLRVVTTGRTVATVGRQNAETALAIVQAEGLTLAASDLGGTRGRVIYFRTDTGEVCVRRLAPSLEAAEEALL